MKLACLGFALAMIVATGPASAADCAVGPEGNLCKAENGDPRAMYMVGRRYYLDSLEADSGDLSDAFFWAWSSNEAGFLGGRMLLKMVYLQLGDGHHHDYVQAHVWLSAAIDGGDEYLVPWRKRLEYGMTDEQIAAADAKAAEHAEE
jgi:TPR repeat protein